MLELQSTPIQPASLLQGSQPLPSTRSIQYIYPPIPTSSKPVQSYAVRQALSSSAISSPRTSRESATARERRIFGGLDDETGEEDLRGPMLDVVLGLLGGLDYDDALC